MKTDETWTVELEHRVGGTPEEVFEYFVDPDKFRRWQGVEVHLEPRPGGAFHVSSVPDVWTRGSYVVVDRPDRIVITWGFESKGPPLPRGLAQVPVASSTVEFTFLAEGEDTIVRVRHSGLPSQEARWAHEQGWRIYLPRLETLRAGREPGEDPAMELAATLFAAEEAAGSA